MSWEIYEHDVERCAGFLYFLSEKSYSVPTWSNRSMDDGVKGSSIVFNPCRTFFEIRKTIFMFMVVGDE